MTFKPVVGLLASAALFALGGVAEARDPSGDLQREIESGRAAVADLERLDERRAVTDETAVLRTWFDEASAGIPREQFDRVREVLDRCNAETELIRQKIATSKVTAQANEREARLRAVRAKLESTKRELHDAQVKKQAMEMNAK